jgi:hypothetical protein
MGKSLNDQLKKKPWSEWVWCQRAIGGIYFIKKWRAETPSNGKNFKLQFENGIFECISRRNGSFVSANDRNFWKEGVKTYLSPTSLVTLDRYWLPHSENHNLNLQHRKTKGSARRCIWRYHFSARVWNCQIPNQVVESQLFNSLWNKQHEGFPDTVTSSFR